MAQSTCTIPVMHPTHTSPCGAFADVPESTGYDSDGFYYVPAMCTRHADRITNGEGMVTAVI